MYCRDQRNQAFKDCSGVVGLVVIAVIHVVYSRCVMSLWAEIGIFETRKTYENLFFFPLCFAWKGCCEDINVESNILARCALLRHEWCSVKIPIEGAARLPFIELFVGRDMHGPNTLNFSHRDILQVPQLAGLLLSHRSQEAFCRRRRGSRTPVPLPPLSLLRFSTSSLLTVVVLLKYRRWRCECWLN